MYYALILLALEFVITELFIAMQVYNDAHILDKILKEKRKELGPVPDDEDVASPKLKLSK